MDMNKRILFVVPHKKLKGETTTWMIPLKELYKKCIGEEDQSDLPALNDPILDCTFNGVKMYFDTFNDLIYTFFKEKSMGGKMKYKCKFCGFEGGWDESDNVNGNIWTCEYCGDIFCTKCFVDRYGKDKYKEMMQGWDLITCPNCYEKAKSDQ